MNTIELVINEQRITLNVFECDNNMWKCDLSVYPGWLNKGVPCVYEGLESTGETPAIAISRSIEEIITPTTDAFSYVFGSVEVFKCINDNTTDTRHKWKII